MKIVLDIEIDRDLKDNDIIIFKNGKWIVSNKGILYDKQFVDLKKENDEIKKRLKDLEENLSKLAKIVKEK